MPSPRVATLNESPYAGAPRGDYESGTCPHCGLVVRFVRNRAVEHLTENSALTILDCDHCQKSTVVIEGGEWLFNSSVPSTLPYFARTETLLIWPPPRLAEAMRPEYGVPDRIQSAVREGTAALGVGAPSAAATQFRAAVELILNDRGGPAVQAKHSVAEKITALSMANPYLSGIQVYAEAIRMIGNAAAHPESYLEVSQDQAQLSCELTQYLIEVLYIAPARVAAMLPQRLPKP